MVELFRIMQGRYEALQGTLAGYQHTGIPLVSYTPSKGVGPLSIDDDLGSYYVIPKLVETFGFSLDTSIQLLYSGSVVLAFILGAIGSWLYCKTRLGKILSIFALAAMGLIIAGVGDVYIFLGATVLALVPWWFYVQDQREIKGQFIFCIIAGVLIGLAHLMRSHSGTAALIFIIISIILTKKFSKKHILALGSTLIVGLFIVLVGFKSLVVEKTDDYLSVRGYVNNTLDQHLFWHSIYLSLGYLNNPYGIEPSDTNAVQKALSINPVVPYASPAYESLLKRETFNVIKMHPVFVFNSLAAKFGVCAMYFFLFSNIGFILALYYRKGYAVDVPFAAGIGFNMLFGVLMTPAYQYLLGLFSFATIYGIYSIDFALNQKRLICGRAKLFGSDDMSQEG